MIKAKFIGCPVSTVEFEYKKAVNLYVNTFDSKNVNPKELNILILLEPKAIRSVLNYPTIQNIIDNSNLFSHIVTYDADLLKLCPKARFWLYGHCSFEGSYLFPTKEFSVSAVTGCKNATIGHQLRLAYYNRQRDIKISRRFYVSSRSKIERNAFSNPFLGGKADDKMKLFDSMFHLCIENSIEPNYFTEKLIDCIRCKTVPIYFGCPNIKNFLNPKGIIKIDSDVDRGIELLNSLSIDLYKALLPIIDENCNLAEKYINFPQRLKNFIGELIE